MPTAIGRVNKTIRQMGSSRVGWLPVAGSQTILKGDVLVTDTNGRLNLGAAQGANIAAPNAAGYGRACIADQDAASLAQDTLIQVVFPADDCVLKFPLTTGGSVQASAQSQFSKGYELRNVAVLTKNCFCVDVSANTNQFVTVRGLDPDTPSGDTDGIVLCSPIAGKWIV